MVQQYQFKCLPAYAIHSNFSNFLIRGLLQILCQARSMTKSYAAAIGI